MSLCVDSLSESDSKKSPSHKDEAGSEGNPEDEERIEMTESRRAFGELGGVNIIDGEGDAVKGDEHDECTPRPLASFLGTSNKAEVIADNLCAVEGGNKRWKDPGSECRAVTSWLAVWRREGKAGREDRRIARSYKC